LERDCAPRVPIPPIYCVVGLAVVAALASIPAPRWLAPVGLSSFLGKVVYIGAILGLATLAVAMTARADNRRAWQDGRRRDADRSLLSREL
jgi:hypothetical protein